MSCIILCFALTNLIMLCIFSLNINVTIVRVLSLSFNALSRFKLYMFIACSDHKIQAFPFIFHLGLPTDGAQQACGCDMSHEHVLER